MQPSKDKRQQGRPTTNIVRAGMTFGYLTAIQKVNSKHAGHTWRMRCVCGGRLTVRQHYLFRTPHPKTSCGCKTYEGKNLYKREKTIWQMMNRRCLYPTHVSWKYYGALGVKPCDRWIETNPDGWKNFIEDMGPAPSMQHTLERLDPFYGYAPFKDDGVTRQCIWATMTAQANNKRAHHIARAKAAENAARIAKANEAAAQPKDQG